MLKDQELNAAFINTASTALKISNNTSNIINLNKLGSLLSTTQALNSVVSSMYGVTAKWFRVVPQDRAKDVIFHEYTLYNNEECGFDINIMYSDSNYDEAALQYNMMGIQYSIPLTCEISIIDWNNATNNDGSIPQKNDVVYIPQSNKLYDVVSVNPVKTVASQITSYKCNLAIHKNKRSIVMNADVEDTIEKYTNSVESIFGNEIKNEIKDIVADKQTSAFNSTIEDKYKSLINNNVSKLYDLKADGHLIANSIYENKREYDYLVKYNISNTVLNDAFLSINFKMLSDIPYSEISISECIKERYFTKYKSKSSYDNNTELICIKGGLKIPGKYLNDYILVDNNILNNIPLNWYKMNGIKVYTNYINLLTCDTVKGLFKIDICNDCLMIVYNDKTIYVPFTITLKNDNWYNLSLNVGANNNISIFDINNEVNELFYKEFKNDNINNLQIDKIYISGSDSNL